MIILLLRVTVGVLQASLALEEELSLKAQLQKLLTVAKNLFTHLGEDNILGGRGWDISRLEVLNLSSLTLTFILPSKATCCDWLLLYSKLLCAPQIHPL